MCHLQPHRNLRGDRSWQTRAKLVRVVLFQGDRSVLVEVFQIDQALRACQLLSGNDVISCYPTSDTRLAQHQWTSFVCALLVHSLNVLHFF